MNASFISTIRFFLFIIIFFSIVFGILKLINWERDIKILTKFFSVLKIAVLTLCTLFFAEIIVSLITLFMVNYQLGFSYATPHTQQGEIFEIQCVLPGKTMDKAGLMVFDQVQMHNVNDLYRLLINNQGKEVVIPVIRNNERIDVRLIVPDLYVPLAGVSFVIF